MELLVNSAVTTDQGHRNEAKSWFDRADRFVRERAPGIRPELEHPPPTAHRDYSGAQS